MKIMAIYPASTLSGWNSFIHPAFEPTHINHGFSMIAGVLRLAGHEVYLNDLREFRGWEDFENKIKSQSYDLVISSFMSCDSATALKAFEIIKKVNPKPIIAGGVHVSVVGLRSFPHVDCIVLGEGEVSMLQVVNEYQFTGILPAYVQGIPVDDLNSLPFVPRDFFKWREEAQSPMLPVLPVPFITMMVGRGCPFQCNFCAPSRERIFGKKMRIRNPESMIAELIQIEDNLKINPIAGHKTFRSIMIHDDLICSREWLGKFCDMFKLLFGRRNIWCQMRADFIIKNKDLIKTYAETGLTWVSLGIESGSPRMLEFMKKGETVEEIETAIDILHENKVNIFGNYILGMPTETPEDIELTRKLFEKRPIAWHSQATYTSYPGSYLYDFVEKNNLWANPNINDHSGHYSMTRFPYERKIKGVDYTEMRRAGNIIMSYKRPYMEFQ